ncbi:MAG: PAS domain-containing protein [Ferruginibacter sp.]
MKNEKQFERTIHNLTDAVYICDADGYITLYNKAAADLWGREPETGKELYSGALKLAQKNGNDLQLENYPIVITLKEHKPIHGAEVIIKRQDGECRHVVQYSSPTFDVLGNLTGVIVRDIEVPHQTSQIEINNKTEKPTLFG